MVEQQLYIFSVISVIFIIILLYKKQNYKQFHWLFIAFMIIYNVFTVLNYLNIKPSFINITFDLSYREDLITAQLMISSLSILVYMFLLLIYKNELILNKNSIYSNGLVINIVFLYLLFYPLSIYFVIHFPWPEYGETITIGNSIAAYLKNIELVLLIMLFIYHPKTYNTFFLITYIVIVAIDTQRTPLLVAFMAYLILSDSRKAIKYTLFLIFGILLLAIIAIYRNGVEISFINLLYPFYYEGIFGSYCALQSLEIVRNYDYSFATNLQILFSPINDVIIKLIPNVYFDIFNGDKNNFYILGSFLAEQKRLGILSETWSPMGGFFYIAESNLMIPYIGPILFTAFLFFWSRKITMIKTPVLKVILYSTLFLYIKANIFIATKYIIFLLIAYYSVIFMDKVFRIFFARYVRRNEIESTN